MFKIYIYIYIYIQYRIKINIFFFDFKINNIINNLITDNTQTVYT